MKYLSYILIPIVIEFIYILAKKESDTAVKENANDFFVMRLPKIYFWIGIIGSIFFISLFILMLLFPNDTAAIWVGVVFIGFSILGFSIIIASLRWKILIYKDHIVYITMYGRHYKYDYSEIKSVKLTENFLKIKTINKIFYVDPHAVGLEVILRRFNENNIYIK